MINLRTYADILSKNRIYSRSSNFIFYTNQLFGSLDFSGKRVLEIGAGKGAFSCYFSIQGASEVVALEPESDGSNPAMLEKFHALIKECGVEKEVKLLPLTFQDYDSGGEKFDIIISHNSINHLDESACQDLLRRKEAQATYRDLFKKMNGMQTENGILVIADCARRSFWGGLGIKTPITAAIDWKKHQQPKTWLSLMEASGYKGKLLRWNSINSFRKPGSIFLNNSVAAYFLNAHFTLTAEKI